MGRASIGEGRRLSPKDPLGVGEDAFVIGGPALRGWAILCSRWNIGELRSAGGRSV